MRTTTPPSSITRGSAIPTISLQLFHRPDEKLGGDDRAAAAAEWMRRGLLD